MIYKKYISVIVISFNGIEFIKDCLRTLQTSLTDIDSEILVIDNGSVDGTIDFIENEFSNIELIKNRDNLGFAKAVNQGFEKATGEYILILNQDTRIVGQAIGELANRMKRDSNIGTIGPKFIGFDGQLQKACRAFPRYRDLAYAFLGLSKLFPKSKLFSSWKMGWFDHLSEAEVDQPMGAALMVSRSVLDKVGMFDERFRIFFNDVDFCRRVKEVGYINLYYPSAVIEHYYGGTIKKIKPQMVVEWHRAISEYFSKYSSGSIGKVFALCWKMFLILLSYPRALYHKYQRNK
ncbi:MAG: glycosyltransferase family 2 protein [candidate division Zixibacteria bacterium]|nr:glycosyltransferase family 2 protein [candidate division Zixibacteria bacterium]